jgi:hypothetical protein
LDALEIYERAPAATEMRDHSIIFPIFSGLFVVLKGGKIQQDKDCNCEQNLANKFVRETRVYGDPNHHTRALAMQCETYARRGKYELALESFDILASINDPIVHAEGVPKPMVPTGLDRLTQHSAIWPLQLRRTQQALDSCEYVINTRYAFRTNS